MIDQTKNNQDMGKEQGIYGIASLDSEDGLGKNNDLLFKIGELYEDTKRFFSLTLHNMVLMGGKTAQSMGHKFPLKNRINIVVTHHPEKYKAFEDKNNEGPTKVFAFTDPERAIDAAKLAFPEKDIYIIGGAEIFKALLKKYCSKLFITRAYEKRDADVFFTFPEGFHLNENKQPEVYVSDYGTKYEFLEYLSEYKH